METLQPQSTVVASARYLSDEVSRKSFPWLGPDHSFHNFQANVEIASQRRTRRRDAGARRRRHRRNRQNRQKVVSAGSDPHQEDLRLGST